MLMSAANQAMLMRRPATRPPPVCETPLAHRGRPNRLTQNCQSNLIPE